MEVQKKFISRREFAQITGRSIPAIDIDLRDHRIPFVKLGKSVLIPASVLDEMEKTAFSSVAASVEVA